MSDIAHVASPALAPPQPPPASVSLGGRVWRTFFSAPGNSAVTLLCAAFVLVLAAPLASWAFVDATWSGTAETCRAAQGGACWAFVRAKLSFILFGFYPAEDHWRPALALAISVGMLIVSAPPRFWGRRLALLWVVAMAAALVLMHGGVLGLAVHPTHIWGGLPLTGLMAVLGLAAAFPLGVLLALGRRSELPLIRSSCIGYIELLRGVPLITILFMASVLFPLLLPQGTTVDKLLRAQVALVMFAAAYIAEVVRGGLQAIPAGQYEAAASLGLGYRLTITRIILPQALKIVIAPLVNIAIGLFKDTSLVIVIGLFDFLTTIKASLNDADWLGFHVEAYLFAAAVYFAFCFSFSRYSLWLETRLSPELRRDE